MTPERARFEAAYAAHGRAVLAYAMRRADPDTAHDVHSETWLIAWRRIDEVPAEPLPWLLGTARRVLANHRRSADRRAALQERLAFDGSRALGDRGVGDGTDGAVLVALERLSESDREALLLVAWDGLKPGEAARALGVNAATFTMRLSRARRRLAAALAEGEPAVSAGSAEGSAVVRHG